MLHSLIPLTVLIAGCALALPEVSLQAAEIPSGPGHFDVYLLAGQSNMAGRGIMTPEDRRPDSRILTFNSHREWVCQGEPIHFDKSVAGVGLGFAFAKQMADHLPGVTMGLIPCAMGGSKIEEWQPGAPLFNNAVERTKLALRQGGVLKGILWHQGESECGSAAQAASYSHDLAKMVGGLRKEFDAPNVPFIAGELGEYLYASPHARFAKDVNAQIDSIPALIPHSAVVPSKGLTPNADQLHIDSASLKEFGKRYFEAFQTLMSTKP